MTEKFKLIGTLEEAQKNAQLIDRFNRMTGEQIKVCFDELEKEMRGINMTLAVENEKQKKLLQDSFKANRDLLKEIKKVNKLNHVLERKLDGNS